MSDAPKITPFPKRFGWLHHRSMAEVIETEELEALVLSGAMMTQGQKARLGVLHNMRMRVLRECGL